MSNITVIGDLILDKFTYGNTDRKNPESPQALLDVESEEFRLGGASNVANNLASLNGGINLIGILGVDYNGKIFKSLCKSNNIKLYSILSENPTITKQRFIDSTYKSQLLRVDYDKKFKLTETQKDKIFNLLQKSKPKYIVISDYNKGIISKDLIDEIKQYSSQNGSQILVDTKPQNLNLFKGVFLIKPNFKEFCEMIGKSIDNTDNNVEFYGKIFTKDYNTNLILTRGEKGASLITKEGRIFHIKPSEVHKIFDVTGAGDTFIATMAYALDNGYSLESTLELANKASGIVVEKVGTAKVTKEELGI